jgi:hypothetical protein
VITVSSGANITASYAISYAPGTLAVTPATLQVIADDKVKRIGEPDPEFTVRYTGFIGGDDPSILSGTLTISRASGEVPGFYAVTPSGTLAHPNYNVVYINGVLEILPGVPGVQLIKTVGTTTNLAESRHELTVWRGTPVYYFFEITNTGTIDLINVELDDPALGLLESLPDLPEGASIVWMAEWVATAGLINTASVTATDLLKADIADEDQATLLVEDPELEVDEVQWMLNGATGLFEGTLRLVNRSGLPIPNDYDFWLPLPVTMDKGVVIWRIWNPAGTQPDGLTYYNFTPQARTRLNGADWLPGQMITLSGLQIYHRQRHNPAGYIDIANSFVVGRLFHPLDQNRNFQIDSNDLQQAITQWQNGQISTHDLLQIDQLSRWNRYQWSKELGSWEEQ